MVASAGGRGHGSGQPVPYLTAAQMREVDRLMVEEYHIDVPRMMESAGRLLARLARRRFLGGDATGKHVVVLAGPGGNGGGALVCARHLSNWGTHVQVSLTRDIARLAPVPRDQLSILERLGVPIGVGCPPRGPETSLVVDGIIGYSLAGAPRGLAAELIEWANGQEAPVLALDIPSGLDATTGIAHEPTTRATATMTLALPKRGLAESGAAPSVGELYLADIGVPSQLYAQPSLGLQVEPLFSREEIVQLR